MSKKRHIRRHLPVLISTLVVLSFGGLVIWLISGFLDNNAPQKKTVQQITLLTPPPPPPPPELEPPPPEPEMEEQVEVPEPETLEDLPDSASDEPPAGDLLGLDAEGGSGGDAFGLIGRKGGRGLLNGGAFGGFAKQLQEDVYSALSDVEAIRKQSYSVVARLWIDESGMITRAELQRGSGSAELDQVIEDTLLTARLAAAPPLEMPQPVRIRITSRL